MTEDTSRKDKFLNNQKKISLWRCSFKTQFKIESLGPFNGPRNPLEKKTLHQLVFSVFYSLCGIFFWFYKTQKISSSKVVLMCTQQLPVLHWIDTKIYRGPQCLCFSKLLTCRIIYLLIWFNKDLVLPVKNKNYWNTQNIHTTHREKGNFRKG